MIVKSSLLFLLNALVSFEAFNCSICLCDKSFPIILDNSSNSCGNDNDDSVDKNVVSTNTIAFQLANEFDGLDINDTNFTTVEVTNEFGTALKMNRIRYLISNVELVDEVGNKFQLKDYNLLDMSDNETFTFNGDIQIPNGNYTLNFVWGFNEEDRIDGAYADLNSASWNWPTGLGGGYHFLQFDGS